MSDTLTLLQRARNSISLGESHFREFKTALEGKPGNKKPRNSTNICREIGEALVAFANADGGELFIGVEDDGTITGIPHGDDDIEIMKNAITLSTKFTMSPVRPAFTDIGILVKNSRLPNE